MRSSHLFVCGNQPSCCQPVSEWHDTLGNYPTAHYVNVTSQCLMCRRVIRQLTFRLAWCREHSAVAATELLQPLDLACGTLFRSSCAIQTSPADCSDHSWRDTFFGKHEHGALWLLICCALEKHFLTYILTYLLTYLLTHSPDEVFEDTYCGSKPRRHRAGNAEMHVEGHATRKLPTCSEVFVSLRRDHPWVAISRPCS